MNRVMGNPTTTPIKLTEEKQAINSLRHYGDANIVPSDKNSFAFTLFDMEDSKEAVAKAKTTDISGEIVIPYEVVRDGKVYRVIGIAQRGFQDCIGITNIRIPKAITLGGACFMNTGITSCLVPDGVTDIPINTFYDCTNLVEVTLPKSITSIKAGSFQNCVSLTDVYYDGTKKEWDKIAISSNGNEYFKNATIHYGYADVTKGYVDEKIGEIDNALLSIIDIQNSLIGGAGE